MARRPRTPITNTVSSAPSPDFVDGGAAREVKVPVGTADTLRIFLSHKMNPDRAVALSVKANLSAFGGKRVQVFCSSDYERGIRWDSQVRDCLTKADWLILLKPQPDSEEEHNWEWCLYETGFFSALMEREPKSNRRMLCLHHPSASIPQPLRQLTHVPARIPEVRELFAQIYRDPPWQIDAALFHDSNRATFLESAIRTVAETCTGGDRVQSTYLASPTITIEINGTLRSEWQKGKIPMHAVVSGEGGWEVLFGKDPNTAAWTWHDLVKDLDDVETWEFQLDALMRDAENRTVPFPSVSVRFAGDGPAYMLTLRRREEFKDSRLRFTFSASRLQLPYRTLPSAPVLVDGKLSNEDVELVVYHLTNIAWFFRRSVLEPHLVRLEGLLVAPADKKRARQATAAIEALRRDYNSMLAVSQIRGIFQILQVMQAFPTADQPWLRSLLLEEWPAHAQALSKAIDAGADGLKDAARALRSMEAINRQFYRKTVECLAERSRQWSPILPTSPS